MAVDLVHNQDSRLDPGEIKEWIDSLDDVLHRHGPEKLQELLVLLQEHAYHEGVMVPFTANTPYINTIPLDEQPHFPGDLEIERRIKSLVRWNALAMVHRANTKFPGIGGHISTYASSATLYEVGFNHFFRAKSDTQLGDLVYFQGHASPGIYARAFLEGRLEKEQLHHFRREGSGVQGLSSYPHPWLMPNFWQFPTVSMGLGPITAIYHARFLRYLRDRKLLDTNDSKVWCFVGDGEVDEPETLGALTLASRENLSNLIFVVNCNLQSLDGPVRGNGKIIQELEAAFRGAGWNCIKVIWGNNWDPILAEDDSGKLVQRMGEILDGQYQKYSVETGEYIRDHFFGHDTELLELVKHLSDHQLEKLRRGGHDPEKVYAAYQAAVKHEGSPTVILAKTIKGYGLGETGEGRNIAHNEKKLNEEELLAFRSRFAIPMSDEDVVRAPFFKPAEDSPEIQYLQERRRKLGGYVPSREPTSETLQIPALTGKPFDRLLKGSGDREASTTMAFVNLLASLIREKKGIGPRIVPIVPDEARTFGMEGMFAQCGIYSCKGQLYDPVDSGQVMFYKQSKQGQILQEGINEAGALSSFIAAGTAYSNFDINMVPFYIYYSMFGFQRIGDLIWCAADSRAKGFLIGGTSGRTTLNGEGLQHEDGHSHLIATTVPTLISFDPAYGYEVATIVQSGLKRMYEQNECCFYYMSVYNENYLQPEMPSGAEEGILKGMYLLQTSSVENSLKTVPQLFGSGPILQCVLAAQKILAEQYQIGTDVWSVTSYSELCRDAMTVSHWNRLHPDEEPKTSYLEDLLGTENRLYVAASDNVRLVPEQIREWISGDFVTLGTDGFGRSETREVLRRHFEVDAESIVYATLFALSKRGEFEQSRLKQVIQDLGLNPEKTLALYE